MGLRRPVYARNFTRLAALAPHSYKVHYLTGSSAPSRSLSGCIWPREYRNTVAPASARHIRTHGAGSVKRRGVEPLQVQLRFAYCIAYVHYAVGALSGTAYCVLRDRVGFKLNLT